MAVSPTIALPNTSMLSAWADPTTSMEVTGLVVLIPTRAPTMEITPPSELLTMRSALRA